MAIIKKYNSLTSEWESVDVAERGIGVPDGGSEYQVLAKNSSNNYDFSWQNPGMRGDSLAIFNEQSMRFINGTGLVAGGLTRGEFRAEYVAAPAVSATVDTYSVSARMNFTSLTGLRCIMHRSGLGIFYSYLNIAPRFAWRDSTGVQRDSAYLTPALTNNAGMRWYRFTINAAGSDTIHTLEIAPDSESEPTSWTLHATATTIGLTKIILSGEGQIGTWIRSYHKFSGTLIRLIERIDGNVNLDVDFRNAETDSLAITESSTNQYVLPLITAAYTYNVPGTQWRTRGTLAFTGGVQYYFPFIVSEKCSVNMIHFSVSTGPASLSNLRYGIYKADLDFQPTGAPLYDSGDISIDTTAASYSKSMQPMVLEPGSYLGALIHEATMTFRVAYGGFFGQDMQYVNTTPFQQSLTVQRAYGAYTTPGDKWDSVVLSGNGVAHPVFLRFTSDI